MASVTRRIRRNLADRAYFKDVVGSYNLSSCPPRFFGALYRPHRRAVVRELVRENTAETLRALYKQTGNELHRLALEVRARKESLR